MEMTILQVNIFICDECGFTDFSTEETSEWSDPVVVSPNQAWGFHPDESGEEPFLCPSCLQKATKVYEAKSDAS
jgi:hypothetical protein